MTKPEVTPFTGTVCCVTAFLPTFFFHLAHPQNYVPGWRGVCEVLLIVIHCGATTWFLTRFYFTLKRTTNNCLYLKYRLTLELSHSYVQTVLTCLLDMGYLERNGGLPQDWNGDRGILGENEVGRRVEGRERYLIYSQNAGMSESEMKHD